LAAGCAGCAAAALLYWVPPAEHSGYPTCPFHDLTGLHCPGCGTLRCLHALLHGNLPQALAYNVLTVLALPFLLAWYARLGLAAWRDRPPKARRVPARWVRVLFAVILAYWVLRNLPWFPFDQLAPHPLG
jgi:hypothetical protein